MQLNVEAKMIPNMDTAYVAGSSRPTMICWDFGKISLVLTTMQLPEIILHLQDQLIKPHRYGRPTLHFNQKYMTVSNSASGFDNWDKITIFAVIDEQSAST